MAFPRRHPELYTPEYDGLQALGQKRTRKQEARLRELATEIRRKRRALEAREQRRRDKAARMTDRGLDAEQARIEAALPLEAETLEAGPAAAVEVGAPEDRAFPAPPAAPDAADLDLEELTPAETAELLEASGTLLLDLAAGALARRGYEVPSQQTIGKLARTWRKVGEAYDLLDLAGLEPRQALLLTAVVGTAMAFGGPILVAHLARQKAERAPEPIEARAPEAA